MSSAAVRLQDAFEFKLTVVGGPHAGQTFQFKSQRITIGRSPENDIVLLNDPLVSRSHVQIQFDNSEFELLKLSPKNLVLVDGQSVDKWKLINRSKFTIGDSIIELQYDFGQAVISVPHLKNDEQKNHSVSSSEKTVVTPAIPKFAGTPIPSQVLQPLVAKPISKQTVPTTSFPPLPPHVKTAVLPPNSRQVNSQNQNQKKSKPRQTSLFDNPRFRFYGIVVIVLMGVMMFFLGGNKKKSQASKSKPVLKYEDEINIKLNSSPEKELVVKRENTKKDRSSFQYQRIQENFVKGMRDFQLGNYQRAQEFFQVVINLDADHALAKRYYYLAKTRFDQLVKAKLMLGESYFSKHNFKMCASMYQQVMNMLDDKKTDANYKLAEKKSEECNLASEGIR